MRVNARFHDDAARQLEELLRMTGKGVTELLRISITHYAAWLRGDAKPRLLHLRTEIGKHAGGRSDVSTRYKELLADSLHEKHAPPMARKTRPAKARR